MEKKEWGRERARREGRGVESNEGGVGEREKRARWEGGEKELGVEERGGGRRRGREGGGGVEEKRDGEKGGEEDRRRVRWKGWICVFFFQAEDGIRDLHVTGVQTCALPIYRRLV